MVSMENLEDIMKRILAVLLALSVLTAFAGCSKKADSAAGGAKKGGTITLYQNKPEIDPQLQAYGKLWSEKTGNSAVMKSIGGSSSITLGQLLRADYAAGEMPDIFIIAGLEDFKEWESIILDMSGEDWTKETSVAFKVDGKTYGFPVAVEGWGMAYNKDMLDKAGIDPAGLTNYGAYKAACEKLDSMKAELGIDSVISMAAGPEMGWVTAHHNFNSLLSGGLTYGDKSVVDDLLAGNVDPKRLGEYADWVELLFAYADPAVLQTGNYDAQVGSFAAGKAVFLHQGNWTDPNMAQANATFKMGFAPHGSMASDTDGIFVSAPSYYVINKESKNVDLARQFLNDMVFTDEGQNFMVKEAGMIPAYGNVKLSPAGQLSQSVQNWAALGKVYSWNQYYFSTDFRDQTLAPIYNQFAAGSIDKAQFVQLLTDAFKNR
jgi:raffinose/stachyose/melibiose transport system substrate-binding protein